MAAALAPLIDALVRHDGEPPATLTDPYAIVLHENAGYLIPDERRDDVYARLNVLAPNPAALLGADHGALLALARDGGMRPEERVERWREIAEITLEEAGVFGAHAESLRRAYGVLRRHGKTICRNARPECPRCPVAKTCPSSTVRP
jgi:endonuclease III